MKLVFKALPQTLVVSLWVYIANVGCSNPHKVVSFNFIYNKFCKPYIKYYFLAFAVNVMMLKDIINPYNCFLNNVNFSIKATNDCIANLLLF